MATLDITKIPAPRVALINENTGLMAREWYRFFYNLFVLAGSGGNQITLDDLQVGPSSQPDLAELLIQINQNIAPQYEDQSGDFLATLDTAQLMSMMSRFENAEAAIQGAYLQPVVQTGTIANYNLDGSPTAGGIVYGTGPALAVSAAGTLGQVLTSAGAGTPTWAAAATGTVTSVSVVSANGLAGTVATATTTPAITLSTTVTGLLKGNGTAISAATSGTDYAPATSGTSILYGNGSGGFSNVTIGTGVAFAGGTLSATGSGGTVTSVTGTAPVVSSGGATPAISMAAATTSVNGYLTSTDWNTFNSKGSGTVTSVAALTLGTTGTDLSSTVATGTTTPVITLQVPTASASNRGALSAADWTTFNSKGSGSVTSVAQSFTGGLISVAGSPITTSGTLALTVAGTSGGIPYFSSATTWATSALLTNNAIMLGGGAAAAPQTTTTGTGVVTALGVNTGTAGAFVVNGGALGTPSSGTVTNLTGTASININGTVGATTANTGAFTTLSATGTLSGGTSGTGYSFSGSAPATSLTLDSSGNLGIGTSSPATKLDVSGTSPTISVTPAAQNQATGINLRVLNGSTYGAARIEAVNNIGYDSNLLFYTNTTTSNTLVERMRLDFNGNLLMGTTSNIINNNARLAISGAEGLRAQATANGGACIAAFATSTGATYYFIGYDLTASAIKFQVLFNGNVQNTNNSYGAISDVKLKENIVDASPKLNDLMQVKVRNYNLKTEPTHKQIGVIAQELETIFPSMVEEALDYDLEGNNLSTTTKAVKYSVFVPMLIKAMQEQQVMINELMAKVATLESK